MQTEEAGGAPEYLQCIAWPHGKQVSSPNVESAQVKKF